MRQETKDSLRLFSLIWLIILIVPATWLIMPVEKHLFEYNKPDILKDYIDITQKSSLTKEDMVEKQKIQKAQLYLINEPMGRNPFSIGEYALRTNATRLKKDIVYDHSSTKKPNETNFILNGITYSENNKIAIINNQVLKEGDKVDKATLIKILKDSVLIEFAEKEITLTIKEHIPK